MTKFGTIILQIRIPAVNGGIIMAFNPINTQEEFDAAISERLRRERESAEKRYSNYDEYKEKAAKTDTLQKELEQLNAKLQKAQADLDNANAKIGDYPAQVESLTARAKQAERYSLQVKVAHDMGLPFELASKIAGENEEEMRTDAEALVPFVSKQQPAPLFASHEDSAADAGYKSLLSSLKGL